MPETREQTLERLKREATDMQVRLSPSAAKVYGEDLKPDLIKTQPPPVLKDLFTIDYRETPASIRDFCHDPYFLGQSLHGALFEQILVDLEELFAGEFSEVLLAGGIGWGKTRMAEVGLAYDLYRLSCLRDPAASYGLIPGSTLALVNVSIKKEQAHRVLFSGMFELVKRAPYFQKTFPYEPNLSKEIRFPNNITCYPVASNETSLLGEGVFSAAFDEMNFMQVVERSTNQPEGGTYDQAQSLYERLSRRMLSRLSQRGRLPGHLWQISSSRYPNDFTERREQDIIAGKTKHVFFRRYAMWETRARSVFMMLPNGQPDDFEIEVGDITRRTRILDGSEKDVNDVKRVKIPRDFYDEVVKDPDKAARDLAGRSVLSIHPFIGRRDKIAMMFEIGERNQLKHPYSNLTVTLQSEETDWFILENLHWIQQVIKGNVVRRLHPGPYFAHVDLAKNGDACGVAIGHPVGLVDIQCGVGPEKLFEKRAMIRTDLVLRVVAPKQGEILAPNVRAIFYKFADLGAMFGLITYDSWGSHESIQLLNSQGFKADNFSMDLNADGYEAAKQALYDERVMCYEVPILQTELSTLMQSDRTGRIDHPPLGSKDVADAWGGMVHHCDNYVVAGLDTRSLAPSRGSSNMKTKVLDKVMAGYRITEKEFDAL